MAIDQDLPDVVREALETADGVGAQQIEVVADGDALVLRGAVATHEEATAAVSVADHHADEVRNELRVDANLREGLGDPEPPPQRQQPERGGSPMDPTTETDDLVDDLQESLVENVAWDPPHEAVEVPTRSEERGTAGTDDDEEAAPAGDAAGDGTKSLADVSPEELSRAAHPEARDEENA